MVYTLHPDLVRDTLPLSALGVDAAALGLELELCEPRVINDATYPWFLLVPRRAGLRDTIDLAPSDHARLWVECRAMSELLMRAFGGEKLNVAALGNMTPQLHLHLVVRYRDDPAWPGPIWGKVPMRPYTRAELETTGETLRTAV